MFFEWSGLALARTCRKIRQEALPIFYALNTFLLETELLEGTRVRRGEPWEDDDSMIDSAIDKVDEWLRLLGHQANHLRNTKIHLGEWTSFSYSLGGATLYGIMRDYEAIFTGLATTLTFVIRWEWTTVQELHENASILSIPLNKLAEARAEAEKEFESPAIDRYPRARSYLRMLREETTESQKEITKLFDLLQKRFGDEQIG